MFASWLVTGESLTCIGSDDPSASVPFCYSGSDLGETADGVASKVTPVWRQDLTVDLSDCVNDVQISSLQCCSDQDEIHAAVVKSFAWRFCSSSRRAVLSARRRALGAETLPSPLLFVSRVRNWERL